MVRQSRPTLFEIDELSKGADNSEDNYARLDELESYRLDDGSFEFKLTWPAYDGASAYEDQVWSQTSNPVTMKQGVEGYKPIDVPYQEPGFGGLEWNGEQAILDGCSLQRSCWWFCVACKSGWIGPGVQIGRLELYVRDPNALSKMEAII